MSQLEKAAEKFDHWMKNDVDWHKTKGHYENNNKALVKFLSAAMGFKYIKTYKEFCILSNIVRETKGYATTKPPCTLLDFALAIDRADPLSFGDIKPLIPEKIKIQLAVENFDHWMQDYVDSHRNAGHYDNNNKALVDFLSSAGGFKYIKTYKDLCELSDFVRQKGYTTSNPPCKPEDFSLAIEKYVSITIPAGIYHGEVPKINEVENKTVYEYRVLQQKEIDLLDRLDKMKFDDKSRPTLEKQLKDLQEQVHLAKLSFTQPQNLSTTSSSSSSTSTSNTQNYTASQIDVLARSLSTVLDDGNKEKPKKESKKKDFKEDPKPKK